mmetsp:Transcript_177805/g.570192  ORF Transcript_177805/g.570192 Transcript_177805/m.570192 type:complete len:255 (-) Transcript_177805:367-1131(-)
MRRGCCGRVALVARHGQRGQALREHQRSTHNTPPLRRSPRCRAARPRPRATCLRGIGGVPVPAVCHLGEVQPRCGERRERRLGHGAGAEAPGRAAADALRAWIGTAQGGVGRRVDVLQCQLLPVQACPQPCEKLVTIRFEAQSKTPFDEDVLRQAMHSLPRIQELPPSFHCAAVSRTERSVELGQTGMRCWVQICQGDKARLLGVEISPHLFEVAIKAQPVATLAQVSKGHLTKALRIQQNSPSGRDSAVTTDQ